MSQITFRLTDEEAHQFNVMLATQDLTKQDALATIVRGWLANGRISCNDSPIIQVDESSHSEASPKVCAAFRALVEAILEDHAEGGTVSEQPCGDAKDKQVERIAGALESADSVAAEADGTRPTRGRHLRRNAG